MLDRTSYLLPLMTHACNKLLVKKQNKTKQTPNFSIDGVLYLSGLLTLLLLQLEVANVHVFLV